MQLDLTRTTEFTPSGAGSNLQAAGFGVFMLLMALWGLAVTIYWMVLAWRAMRAHERLAEAAERMANAQWRAQRARASPGVVGPGSGGEGPA